MHIERGRGIERNARFAFIAGFEVLGEVGAVDRLGKDAGAGGFAYPSRTAKQESLRKLVVTDSVFKGIGNGLLPHHRVEGLWPVFASRYDKILHPVLTIYYAMRGFKITKILFWFISQLKSIDKKVAEGFGLDLIVIC